MSARTRFNRSPSQEALAAIQASLERPTVEIPEPSFGKHEAAWTRRGAWDDRTLADKRWADPEGKHRLDQSATAPKVYPFSRKTMTEAEWPGRAS